MGHHKHSGHGFSHYVTPGWTIPEKRLSPHIAEPGMFCSVVFAGKDFSHVLAYVQEMLKKGEDPKSLLMEDCKPHCTHWADKLSRCEKELEHIIKVNPTKSCIYPFRDWVTCVEACVSLFG